MNAPSALARTGVTQGDGHVTTMGLSPDDRLLAVGCSDGSGQLWGLDTRPS
jgi:hypothetical protein